MTGVASCDLEEQRARGGGVDGPRREAVLFEAAIQDRRCASRCRDQAEHREDGKSDGDARPQFSISPYRLAVQFGGPLRQPPQADELPRGGLRIPPTRETKVY